MAAPPQEPTETPPPDHRPEIRHTDIEPVCDENMGGGGSNTGTRFRGMPGGWPGGPLDEGPLEKDCEAAARGEPDRRKGADQPTPDGKGP